MKCSSDKNRIAILTFHNAFNCGAVLQAWALQTVLRRLGYDPEFPDCTKVGHYRLLKKVWYKRDMSGSLWRRLRQELSAAMPEIRKRFRFRRFLRKNLALRTMEACDIETRYQAVIVGSDQVWNEDITRREDGYFLTAAFRRPTLRRYSYAVSVGDRLPTRERLDELKVVASRFENLSFREGFQLDLTDAHGRPPIIDPDPSLLLKREDYDAVSYPASLEKRPYLLVYALVYVESTWEAAQSLAKKMGLKLVVLHMYQYGRYGIDGADGAVIDVSPDRFLAYFRDAAAIVTSTFHGTAFSLVYGKPFAVLPGYGGKISFRIVELLRTVHESERMVSDPTDACRLEKILADPVRHGLVEDMRRLRESSVGRLRGVLGTGTAA